MTNNEQLALDRLRQLASQNKWTAMELWPAVGHTMIEETGNRLKINDGADGEWDDIGTTFYDAVVCSFDSRELIADRRNRSCSVADMVNKFCDGPAATSIPDAIPDCRDCTTLEDLIETVNRWMDFDNSAQAALFVIDMLDYETD
jgi:hypothetical protein